MSEYRICIDMDYSGPLVEFGAQALDVPEGSTAEQVLVELQRDNKWDLIRELGLIEPDDVTLNIQVRHADGTYTRAEW